MEIVSIKTKDGEKEVAIYNDDEKDYQTDLAKTEDYGKLVDVINEQKKNK